MIAARDYTKPLASGSGGDVSDPTYRAAERGTATEMRGRQILTAWRDELVKVRDFLWFLCEITEAATCDTPPPVRPGRSIQTHVATCLDRIAWLCVKVTIPDEQPTLIDTPALIDTQAIPSRLEKAMDAATGEDLREIEAAIDGARSHMRALRDGPLDPMYVVDPESGKQKAITTPSVFHVLETARLAMKVRVEVPQPKQLAPDGCVSCKRDGGHFEPIDDKNHSARRMCRACGDYTSGEGRMPPLAAVKYRHRTGKRWTWKVLQEALQAERRGA